MKKDMRMNGRERATKMKYRFKQFHKSELLKNHLNMGGVNPEGEEINVTSLYFTRGGKPWIGIMGEYHFTRDLRENWYRELCKMKAGGITIVATYMFWIYHEEIEHEFNFTGDRDIRYFVECAERAGLDVFLRLGPWAHGECRNGGFPDWLLKKEFKLRDNNPEYLSKARIWYEKIFEQIKGLQYKDGGNIIGVQFENELVDNPEHLHELKKIALEVGFDVPLYTVTGWNSRYGAQIPVDEVVPVFAAYVEAPWENCLEKMPLSPHFTFDARRNDSTTGTDVINEKDESGWKLPYERYPFATCELGAGIQSNHHRRIVCSGLDAYALSLVKLGCGNNLVGYYMYHGGTNKIGKLSTLNESRATGYAKDCPILNYDYHTALTSYGETRAQYGLLNLLHLFVKDFGDILAPMENVHSDRYVVADDLESLRYCMRSDGSGGFIFVNHYQRLAELKDVRNAVFYTEKVTFPPIDVTGKICFFMPFNMNLSGTVLTYATAQPLCRTGNTYFFMEIEGIIPQYQFEDGSKFEGKRLIQKDGIQIVTLDQKQALFARKINDRLYIGSECDIYEMDGEIKAIQDGCFEYQMWNGSGFDTFQLGKPVQQPVLILEETEEPFVPPYLEELDIGGPRKRTWKKLSVSNAQGFVEISGEYDAGQIYADGEMVADYFYFGEPWRFPASLIYGKESYLVTTEIKNDCYLEYKHFDPKILGLQ